MNEARIRLLECLFTAIGSASEERHEADLQLSAVGALSADEAEYLVTYEVKDVRVGFASVLEALTSGDCALRERCTSQLVADSEPAVRSNVCESFLHPDELSAAMFDRVVALVGDETWYVRAAVVGMLGRSRRTNGIVSAAFERAVADEHSSVRCRAIGSIGERGILAVTEQPLVERCLADHDGVVRDEACRVILAGGYTDETTARAAGIALRESYFSSAIDACRWCAIPGNASTQHIQLLIDRLGNEHLAKDAMRVLKSFGTEAIPFLLEGVNHQNPAVRARTVRLIREAASPAPTAYDICRYAFLHDCDLLVRLQGGLGMLGDEQFEPALGELALCGLLSEAPGVPELSSECLIRLHRLPNHAADVLAEALRSRQGTRRHALQVVRRRRLSDRQILNATLHVADTGNDEDGRAARSVLRSIAIRPEKWNRVEK